MNQAFSQILQTEHNSGRAEGRDEENAEIKEIIRLLNKGKSNASIARTLNIEEEKVEDFRKLMKPVN